MIPHSRPKRSDLYTLSQSKLLENHTLHSGTYPYSPYMAVLTPGIKYLFQYEEVLEAKFMFSFVYLVQRDSSESEPCVSQTPDSLDQIVKEEATSEPTNNGVKSETQTVEDCKLAQLQDAVTSIESRATYWHTGWRSNLCKCDKCMVSLIFRFVVPALEKQRNMWLYFYPIDDSY